MLKIRVLPHVLSMRGWPRLIVGVFCIAMVWSCESSVAGDLSGIPTVFSAEYSRWGHEVSVRLVGETLLYQNEKRTIKLSPTRTQWQSFRHALDENSVWSWKGPYYRPVFDGPGLWTLHIKYSDREIKTGGRAWMPGPESPLLNNKTFNRYLFALQKLTGGRQFVERRIGELELFDLSELRLIRTHPSNVRARIWAEFADPQGKQHRVAYRQYVGTNFGVVQDVRNDLVILKEIATDTEGEWYERDSEIRRISE